MFVHNDQWQIKGKPMTTSFNSWIQKLIESMRTAISSKDRISRDWKHMPKISKMRIFWDKQPTQNKRTPPQKMINLKTKPIKMLIFWLLGHSPLRIQHMPVNAIIQMPRTTSKLCTPTPTIINSTRNFKKTLSIKLWSIISK